VPVAQTVNGSDRPPDILQKKDLKQQGNGGKSEQIV
jgi:hypothetical protein